MCYVVLFFSRHSPETKTAILYKHVLSTHQSTPDMFALYHVAGGHTFVCDLSCTEAHGVSRLLFVAKLA